MSPRPLVGRRAIEVLVETRLSDAASERLVLVDAGYDAPEREADFAVTVAGRSRRVHLSDQDSLLGIAEVWQRHQAADRDGDSVLVVTGSVPASQIGWDIRAHALGHGVYGVDRAEIVKYLFGATDLDPRMAGERWLLDALVEAEPVDGWPRAGSVLTRDRAVGALLTARLRLGDTSAGTLDLDTDVLFAWTRDPAGPQRFAGLSQAERDGLSAWLAEAVGPAAVTLLTLAADGRGQDALPLGVLASAALTSTASEATGFALGTLFGSALTTFEALRPFSEAAVGVLTRWIAQAEGSGNRRTDVRGRVFDVLDRADQLAEEARLSPMIGADPLLPAGYRARLRRLATLLDGAAPMAEAALRELTEHQLALLYADSTHRARTAVRLVRWLDEPLTPATSVARSVHSHLNSSAWVDAAVGILAEGDTGRDPVVSDAYQRLVDTVRTRRTRLDEEFARRLVVWTESASQEAPGDALLIEDVLAEAVVPLSRPLPVARESGDTAVAGEKDARNRERGRPLILVLDGMSANVALQLVAGLDRRVWTEVVPKPGPEQEASRRAAVAMLPTVTTVSRASLLSGQPAEGGQSVERAGFTAFWKRRHRGARLFHKGGYEGPDGHRLAPELLDALASDDVVAVVVNTVDDTLADGREGARGQWRPEDVGKLPDLLNAARDYGRSVVLVSDHGHVLERGPRDVQQTAVEGARGARWRTGEPGDGEVALFGPRVHPRGSRLTLPWREDLRYTARQAGYHGGASLAEVTVPVITLVPSPHLVPEGWTMLPAESVAPAWWQGRQQVPLTTVEMPSGPQPAVRARPTATADHEPAVDTLGWRTVASEPYKALRRFVRGAPSDTAVAAVLDALITAGGKLSPSAVATAAQAATGKSERNPGRFATVLERLLNIDGYPVLQLVESGRTVQLDRALLAQQFLGEAT